MKKVKKEPHLPTAINRESLPVDLTCTGRWMVLSDVHLPYYDKLTVEKAVETAKQVGIKGFLLNGDIADFHELSKFDKTPDDPRYSTEVGMVRQFLEYLRYNFPKVRIVWKDGNHEERLLTYLCNKAPALFGLDVLTIPNLMKFGEYDVEYVTDRRVIRIGRLNVIHGHEYRPGIQTPVNPARGLFLRAKSVALCGHFHQTSEHHERTITGKPEGAWSIGCACILNPLYMPLNKWNHGFAIVEVGRNGDFGVENKRIINGEVV